MVKKLISIDKKPCSCGHNRWKTKEKRCYNRLASVYQCRKCGETRDVTMNDYRDGLAVKES